MHIILRSGKRQKRTRDTGFIPDEKGLTYFTAPPFGPGKNPAKFQNTIKRTRFSEKLENFPKSVHEKYKKS